MNKVLVLSTWSRPGGGPQGYTYNLRQGLENLETQGVIFDFWCSIIINSRKHSGESIKQRLLRLIPSYFHQYIVVFGVVTGLFKFWLNKELRGKIAKSDIIVVNDQNFALLVPLMKSLRKRFIYMQHTPTSWTEEVVSTSGLINHSIIIFVCSRIEKYLLASCDEVIVPSLNSVNAYDEFKIYSKKEVLKKARIIASGAPKLQPTNQQSFKVNAKISVGYLGRYHEHKGFDKFIELANLSLDDDNYHFYSAGTGSILPAELRNYTNYGWTSNVADFINDMDIIMCPNRYTYFDLLPLEVLSLGKVLIVSQTGGNIDLLGYTPGVIGVNGDDTASYKMVLDKVVDSDDFKQEKLQHLNKIAYNKHFTLEKMANRYIDSFG